MSGEGSISQPFVLYAVRTHRYALIWYTPRTARDAHNRCMHWGKALLELMLNYCIAKQNLSGTCIGRAHSMGIIARYLVL